MPETEWVLLAYRLPREPSTPRTSVWRKLRRLGAVQLGDGLVALPANARTVEALDWVADEVVDAGGVAWTWRGRPGSKAQEQSLRQQMTAAAAEEYRALIAEAKDAGPDTSPLARTIERLKRELQRIESRDHFGPKEREQARRAVERLSAAAQRALR